MRRLEMTWDDGNWPPEIAEEIVAELLDALDNPQLSSHPWVRPDSVRMVRSDDPIYPDGPMRRRDGSLIGDSRGSG